MLVSIAQDKPKKLERTIKGWIVSLEGEFITIVMPSGNKTKIHVEEAMPKYLLVTKEVQVLTKKGFEYRQIKMPAPSIPIEVEKFIKTLKKAFVLR